MLVNRVTSFNNKYAISENPPSFGSLDVSFHNYIDDNGIQHETQTSTGIRGDIRLEDFVDTTELRFWGVKTVNIIPMSVSDGTEAYAFANAIIRREGLEKFKRKYRVIASDVVPSVINNYAQKGLLYLEDKEKRIFKGLGINALEEVKPECITRDGRRRYQLSDEYRGLFEFHVEDMRKRIRNLEDEGNSIVIIRNSLKDNFPSEQIEHVIISQLAKKMNGRSILITGKYDRKEKYIREILKEDFVELTHNIWGLKKYGVIRNYLTKFALQCMKI